MGNEALVKEIARLKERVNDISKRIDDHAGAMHEETKAKTDYIAMMTDVDLDSEEV